ncbi:MAG: hypothetical protein ACTSRG_17005 [Candidatus Helarchaeota archaeon]
MTRFTVIDKNVGMDILSINWTDEAAIFSGLTSGSISATEEALSTKVALKGGDILEDGSRIIYSNSDILNGISLANKIYSEIGLEKQFPEFSELITVLHVGPPEISDEDTIKIRRFGEILSAEILIRKNIGEFLTNEVPSDESVIDLIKNSIKRWLEEGNTCWYEPKQLKINFEQELKEKIPFYIKRVYYSKFQQINPLTFFNSYEAEKAQKQIIKLIEQDVLLFHQYKKELKKFREEKEKIIKKKFLKELDSIPKLKDQLDHYQENLKMTISGLNAEFSTKSQIFNHKFDLSEIDMIEALKQVKEETLEILNRTDFQVTGLNHESLAKYNIVLPSNLEDLNLKNIKSKLDRDKENLKRNHQDTTEIDKLLSALSEIVVLNQTKKHFEKKYNEIINKLKKIPEKYLEITEKNTEIKNLSENLSQNVIQNGINLVFNDYNEHLELFIINPEYFKLIEDLIETGFKNFSNYFFKEIGPISILSDVLEILNEKVDKKNLKQRKLLNLATSFLNKYENKPLDIEAINKFFNVIKRAELKEIFLEALNKLKQSDQELTKGNQGKFIEIFEGALNGVKTENIPRITPEGMVEVRYDFIDSILQCYLEIYREIFGTIKLENQEYHEYSSKLLDIFLDRLIFYINILKYFYVLEAIISEIDDPQLKTINFIKVLPYTPHYFQCSSCIDCFIKGKSIENFFSMMKREVFKTISIVEEELAREIARIPGELRKKNRKFDLKSIEKIGYLFEFNELYNASKKLIAIVKENNFSVKSIQAFVEGKGDDRFKELNLKKIRNKYEKISKNIRKNAEREFNSLEKSVNTLIQKKYLKYLPKKYPDEKKIKETLNKIMKKNKKLLDSNYSLYYDKILARSLIFNYRNLLPKEIDDELKSQKINYNEKITEIINKVQSFSEITKKLIYEIITDESLVPFLISKIHYNNSVPVYSFPIKLKQSLINDFTKLDIDKIFGKNILLGEKKSDILGILFKAIKLEKEEKNFGSLIFAHSYNITKEKYREILDELSEIGKMVHSKFEKDFYNELFHQTFFDIKEKLENLSE